MAQGDAFPTGERSPSAPVMLLAVVGCAMAVGWCGSGCRRGPARIQAPDWEPVAIAGSAIEQLDANGDGLVDRDECAQAPGLLYGFDNVDSDADGQISTAELQSRFELYRNMRTGLRSQAFRISWNGKPLARATIRLVPESFLGGVIEAAEGTTDELGVVMPRAEGQDIAAVRTGYYRVEVASTPNRKTPQKQLGVEVPPVSEGANSSGMVHLDFK